MTRTLHDAPPPAHRERPQRTRARQADAGGAIRVFFVEDQDIYRNNLAAYVEDHPDSGVELVGWKTTNSEDLPNAVREAGADLVLVDLKLTTDNLSHPSADPVHRNGLKACQRLKQHLPEVTVVAYTQFPFLRKDAKDHGADEFLLKLRDRELVDALHAIRNRTFVPPPLPDTITALKLSPAQRLVSIDVHGASTIEFTLIPVAFALLWYLAEERRADGDGWLTFVHQPDPHTRVAQSRWAIRNPATWSTICRKVGSEYGARTDLAIEDLDRWRNLVNGKVKGRIESPLLSVSGRGPFRAGEHRVSCLRRSIGAGAIAIV